MANFDESDESDVEDAKRERVDARAVDRGEARACECGEVVYDDEPHECDAAEVNAKRVWDEIVAHVAKCSTSHKHAGEREQRDCYTTTLWQILFDGRCAS